jgi:hypothetical protein
MCLHVGQFQCRSQNDNWGGAHIHIFVFCFINFFWNQLFLWYVNTNIWICAPPPPCYGTGQFEYGCAPPEIHTFFKIKYGGGGGYRGCTPPRIKFCYTFWIVGVRSLSYAYNSCLVEICTTYPHQIHAVTKVDIQLLLYVHYFKMISTKNFSFSPCWIKMIITWCRKWYYRRIHQFFIIIHFLLLIIFCQNIYHTNDQTNLHANCHAFKWVSRKWHLRASNFKNFPG